jgi:hypothetical protein
MQISGRHPGFGFLAACQAAIAPAPAGRRELKAGPAAIAADEMHRQAMLIRAAQRSAERTAAMLESMPDL